MSFTGWPKKFGTIMLCALTLPNINRFSKLFHYQNQEKICNNTITKDPITTQLCRCTTLWNVKCSKKARIENKTTSVTTHFKKLTTENNVFIISAKLSKVTVTSCNFFYIKCSMYPPCCWTTHSSRRRHWPISGVAGLSASTQTTDWRQTTDDRQTDGR